MYIHNFFSHKEAVVLLCPTTAPMQSQESISENVWSNGSLTRINIASPMVNKWQDEAGWDAWALLGCTCPRSVFLLYPCISLQNGTHLPGKTATWLQFSIQQLRKLRDRILLIFMILWGESGSSLFKRMWQIMALVWISIFCMFVCFSRQDFLCIASLSWN